MKDQLFPSSWEATEIVGATLIAGSHVTLAFDAAGRVHGNAGCNNYSGGATLHGDQLVFTPLASTRMACADARVGAQEAAYFSALGRTERVSLTADGILEIYAKGETGPSRFKAEAAQPIRITGSATYRQRVALPPGSRLEVKVEDVSLADAASVIIAEKTIAITGQVPVSFEIAVDPARLAQGRSYALRATIYQGTQMLFTTDERNSVLAEGDPERFDLVLVQVSRP